VSLTDVDEDLLNRLRDWLIEARVAAAALSEDTISDPATSDRFQGSPEAGLYQLAEGFSALRQELKLQTKSARNLQDQTEQAVQALNRSLESVQTAETQAVEAARAAFKPREDALLDAYMNLDDALERGRGALESVRQKILHEAAQPLLQAVDAQFARLGWWSRRISSGFYRAVRTACQQQSASQKPLLDSLVEGYGLIQNRLHKAMKAENLERIPAVGYPVDLNCMTVVEAVADPSKTPGTVVREIRRGYRCHGKIIRFAEVAAVTQPQPV